MNKSTITAVAAATTALSALGGTLGYRAAEKQVEIAIDGAPSTRVDTFGSTVADALAKRDIEVGEHDTVIPAPSSRITDGTQINVAYGRPLNLTLDGRKTLLWTTATTLDGALVQAGVDDADTRVSLSRSTPLGREGLSVSAVTPKAVSLQVAGKESSVESAASTVADLLREEKITLGAKDVVKPSATTPISQGLRVSVQRVGTATTTTTSPIEHRSVRTESNDLAKGTTKVTRKGVDGVTTQTWQVTTLDGKQTARKLLSTKVTRAAVDEVVSVGTRTSSNPTPSAQPAATKGAATSTKAATRSTTAGSGAGLNLARAAMWDRIAQCESGGNWSINTGNGYFGGLQFDRQTWLAAGGGSFAPRADQASRAQQITIANKLYAERGLAPWGCAHAA